METWQTLQSILIRAVCFFDLFFCRRYLNRMMGCKGGVAFSLSLSVCVFSRWDCRLYLHVTCSVAIASNRKRRKTTDNRPNNNGSSVLNCRQLIRMHKASSCAGKKRGKTCTCKYCHCYRMRMPLGDQCNRGYPHSVFLNFIHFSGCIRTASGDFDFF